MAIAVDLSNPPPWIVHVTFPEGVDATWPFPDEALARDAYKLAVSSGQFTRVLRQATKRLPAITVTLVTLFRLEPYVDIHGQPRIHYLGVNVPEQAA